MKYFICQDVHIVVRSKDRKDSWILRGVKRVTTAFEYHPFGKLRSFTDTGYYIKHIDLAIPQVLHP